ncbi:MAG TPA: trypsin-like serine protease, partial [Polyangiaceae bacterium]|nr:trypsin-like serine protease [Polyangiaceae bacterium]
MSVRSNWLKLFGVATTTALAGAYGCSDAGGESQKPEVTTLPDDSVEALVGGVRINSKSLDAVGALGFTYDYGTGGTGGIGFDGGAGTGMGGDAGFAGGADAGSPPFRATSSVPAYDGSCYPYGCYVNFNPICTGTLIGPTAVLTSRGCAANFDDYYYRGYPYSRFQFAVGAELNGAERRFDIVHISYPASGDLAVVHLGEPVSGVAAFPLANLNANHVGQKFAALGYGSHDPYAGERARRAGAVTLRGIEGRLYEFAFGSFEAFLEYNFP